MRRLRRFEARDVVADETRQHRFGAGMLIKGVENRGERGFDALPEFTQVIAGRGIDAHEAQSRFAIRGG